MKHKPKIAIIRGKFLNAYEMQFFEPLIDEFDVTAFGSLTPFCDRFAFPVVKLPCPLDLPHFPLKNQILNRLFIDAHYLWGLEEKLVGFDLVHTAETYYHYTIQALNTKKRGGVKKVIATVLENIPHNNEGIWGRRSLKRRARAQLDHMIALTGLTRDVLVQEGADFRKISAISHFIDTRRFFPDQKIQKELSDRNLEDIRILFVGRLEYEKGIVDVLEAFERLLGDTRMKSKRITLDIVGHGSLRAALDTLVQKKRLTDVVRFQNIPYLSMPAVYRHAHILVAPSKATPTWEEQYSTSLLEAQASGLPIITTNTGGIPENVGDAAVVTSPGNVTHLYDAIVHLISDSKLRSMYARKARQRALDVHDILIGAKKIGSLYKNILQTEQKYFR